MRRFPVQAAACCVSFSDSASVLGVASLGPSMALQTALCHSFYEVICNWRIIALPYGVGFCQTSTQISRRNAHAPPLEPPPHPHPHPPLAEHRLSPAAHGASRWLLCTGRCVSLMLLPALPASPCPRAYKAVLYVCVLLAALHTGSSSPHLS